ncbi:MAG: dihydroorotate dehydrogenase electron transfer subunit [Bacteroidia bacterium]|nr:MAG: dihydroorotate dehydrogenase electron transfer subunit [Bacteroidia bacterium]
MAKRIEDFTVKENRRLNNDLFILELTGNNYLPSLKPGQFVQVKIEGSPETFLRRPISIHDVDYEHNTIKMLIQIAGRGTKKLSSLKQGEILNIIYPLGNSFTLPAENAQVLLIGGGCGVAPLMFLGKHLKSKGYKPEILLGFRNFDRIIEFDEYSGIGPVYLTTEDGSKGEKGFVTDHTVLKDRHFDHICCCGPESMMKAVAGYCLKKGISCEVSLEHLMACGFGVCLCCVVNTVNGNLCTCLDGPVFNTKELKW